MNKCANLDPKFPIFILLVTDDVDAGDLGDGDLEVGVGGGIELGTPGGLGG